MKITEAITNVYHDVTKFARKVGENKDVQVGIHLLTSLALCFPVTRAVGFGIFFGNQAVKEIGDLDSAGQRLGRTLGFQANKDLIIKCTLIATAILGLVGSVASAPALIVTALVVNTAVFTYKAFEYFTAEAATTHNKTQGFKNLGMAVVSTGLLALNVPSLILLSPPLILGGAALDYFASRIK